MKQINQTFATKVFELAGYAYASDIECPPLRALYDWTAQQQLQLGTSLSQAPATANLPPNFDDAVLQAVQSSPNGIDLADLRPVLAQYNRPSNQIGAALGRLKRAGKITRRDKLWHIAAAGEIDKSIDTRRRNRKTKNAATAGNEGADTAAEAQQAVA